MISPFTKSIEVGSILRQPLLVTDKQSPIHKRLALPIFGVIIFWMNMKLSELILVGNDFFATFAISYLSNTIS